MIYTPEELKEVDNRVRAQFEDRLRRFCAEVPNHDFTRDEYGNYINPDVYGLFAGYILNFLCEFHTRDGVKVVMKPDLLALLPTVESYLPVQCDACFP